VKIWATISDDEWQQLEPYVTCHFQNPMEDEFEFFDPPAMLFWRLASLGIPFGVSEH
jgi:hypothetical protein